MNGVLGLLTIQVLLGTLIYYTLTQSGNIYVQQHKTSMMNEEWNITQNDAPLSPFTRAVTFVLPDEMASKLVSME